MRPIDADALFDLIKKARINSPDLVCKSWVLDNVADMIIDMPTLDYAPVEHGKWESVQIIGYDGLHPVFGAACSECGAYSEEYRRLFCSNCGAKMDGGK